MLSENFRIFLKVQARFAFGDDKRLAQRVVFEHGVAGVVGWLFFPGGFFRLLFLATAGYKVVQMFDFFLINETFFVVGADLDADGFVPFEQRVEQPFFVFF